VTWLCTDPTPDVCAAEVLDPDTLTITSCDRPTTHRVVGRDGDHRGRYCEPHARALIDSLRAHR
jgi:hypothetical protein